MDDELRKYFSKIGRLGGKANKGKSSEKCRKAAQVRWQKFRDKKKSLSQDEDE
tara:strand:+ start:3088 stop:3246 length:159 start_codon:yes stop_codon:yes gene_type:complete